MDNNKEKLLDTLYLWQSHGIESDVMWRDEYKPFITEIKTKHPEYTEEQIIEQLEKDLKQCS